MQKLEEIQCQYGTIYAVKGDDRIGATLKKTGTWEKQDLDFCIRLYKQFCQPTQSVILDIGANVGTYGIPLAQYFPSKIVHCFECQELLATALELSVQKNNLSNLIVHHVALSNLNNQEFQYNKIDYDWLANFGSFELEMPFKNSDFNGRCSSTLESVPMATIDSFNLDGVGFIKLDVEGMELKILQGAIKTIDRCQPMIVYENHKTDVESLNAFVEHIGYVQKITNGLSTFIVPKKNK